MKQLQFGKIVKDIYITPRDFGTHFMKKFDAFGISEDVLKTIQNQGVKRIIIRTKDQDYLFYIEQYLEGILYTNQDSNGDLDRQRFVSIREAK